MWLTLQAVTTDAGSSTKTTMADPTKHLQNPTTEQFELDERQRLVVEMAERLGLQARSAGRFPPPQLAQRMQDEQDLAFPATAVQEVRARWPSVKRLRRSDSSAGK